MTPLHDACTSGSVNMILLLVRFGARKDAKDRKGYVPRYVPKRMTPPILTMEIQLYRVTHLLADLGSVDFDLGSYPGLLGQ